jgi:hypothetical protein
MKTIAGYTLMGFGVYYLLVELGGVGAMFKLLKSAKQYMPQYSDQIAKVEQKITPQLQQIQQLNTPSTPNPTPTLIPNSPSPNPESEGQWGVNLKLKTPWSSLETKANAK